VLVLAAATALLALAACSNKREAVPGQPAKISTRLGALTITVPQGFSQRDIQGSGGRVIGVVISDYRVKAHSPTLTEGIFPGNGVALAIGQPSHAPAAVAPLHLPLSLSALQGPEHHADGTAWNGLFRFHGRPYTVSFWAGRTSPRRDHAALRNALVSLHLAR
jgi:hypothetical protein